MAEKIYEDFLKYKPIVKGFFDNNTNTISYVVFDESTNECAIIDSVMDYDSASGTVYFDFANKIIKFITDNSLQVKFILETHVHADHLSAAPYIQSKLGGTLGISEHIMTVQDMFGKVFNEGTDFERDGSQFDILLKDGDELHLGNIPMTALYTPGHTPADMVFVIGDSVFAGDTLFMPDYGTARCDFPGGSAETMYESIQKIFELPDSMRMFMCHDYLPEDRFEYAWETTVGEQKKNNIHLQYGKDAFVKMRNERDEQLNMPRLIIPSIQVNMRAGNMPKAEDNGIVYLKTPINGVFSTKKFN